MLETVSSAGSSYKRGREALSQVRGSTLGPKAIPYHLTISSTNTGRPPSCILTCDMLTHDPQTRYTYRLYVVVLFVETEQIYALPPWKLYLVYTWSPSRPLSPAWRHNVAEIVKQAFQCRNCRFESSKFISFYDNSNIWITCPRISFGIWFQGFSCIKNFHYSIKEYFISVIKQTFRVRTVGLNLLSSSVFFDNSNI